MKERLLYLEYYLENIKKYRSEVPYLAGLNLTNHELSDLDLVRHKCATWEFWRETWDIHTRASEIWPDGLGQVDSK